MSRSHSLVDAVQWGGARAAMRAGDCSFSRIQNLVIQGRVRSINPPDRMCRLYNLNDVRAVTEAARAMMATA